jgi:hypothetical protein
MDAGGASFVAHNTEPAGCGRPPRHPAAWRAAKKQACHCPDFHQRSRHDAGVE